MFPLITSWAAIFKNAHLTCTGVTYGQNPFPVVPHTSYQFAPSSLLLLYCCLIDFLQWYAMSLIFLWLHIKEFSQLPYILISNHFKCLQNSLLSPNSMLFPSSHTQFMYLCHRMYIVYCIWINKFYSYF